MKKLTHSRTRRRATWTVLFLICATISMVGPTHAVSGAVAASVAAWETFGQVLGNGSTNSHPSARAANPTHQDDPLTLEFDPLSLADAWLTGQGVNAVPGVVDTTSSSSSSWSGNTTHTQPGGGAASGGGGNGGGGSSHAGVAGSGLGGGATDSPSMSTVAGEEPVTTDLVSEPGPVTVQQSLQGTVASNFPSDLSLDSLGGGASNGPAGPPTDLTTSWRPPQGDEASGYLPAPLGASDGLPPGSGDLPAVLDPHSFLPPFPDQEPPPLIASGPVTENPNRILGDVAADIAQVPEPSTLLLMALGVLAAERGRRRRGRQPPV